MPRVTWLLVFLTLAACEDVQPRRLAIFDDAEKISIGENIGNITDDRTKAVVTLLQNKLDVVGTALDFMWLLVCGALVMFMQAGFAILESGTCRQKNAGMVLMKNIVDVCLGTIMWWLVGWGFAYGVGDSPNEFIGTTQFAGTNFQGATYRDFFFQWAFCATAATIVSGGVAERINFTGYVVYSMFMTGFIYPIVVYWTWSGEGFLSNNGYSDFAGSGIVHMVGGFGALVGAVMLGPRNGRWEEGKKSSFDPHNMGLVVLGTLILWFGWYGFNCGSTLSFSDMNTVVQAALVAMNTTLAAATGGISVFILRKLQDKEGKYDLAGMCNGILAGLVAVCAGVGDMEPGMAVLTGLLGGIFMEAGHLLIVKLQIDDPLDAFAVHGCGGLCGVLTRPVFDKAGANGSMFGAHCLGALCIIAWVTALSFIVFGVLKAANVLKVSDEEAEKGSDKMHLQTQAYRATSKTVGEGN